LPGTACRAIRWQACGSTPTLGRDAASRHPGAPGEALIPQTFGPYELDELLGRGPTGEVYRAWDTRRSRTVALEILSPRLGADPWFRARFEQVSGAVAGIDEPHVVAVHEVGEIDGRLYRDVQLVDGRALSAVLAAEGPLPAPVAVDVVGQVAAALDAAHAVGVAHGSVRPSDVLLSGHADRPECHLTHFGLHLDGRPADQRADVRALALLLVEVLTGRPAVPDGDGAAPEGTGRHREPPPRSDAVPVPAALQAVVARGTAEDPADRYPSAGALAAAARATLNRSSDTVPVRAVAAPAPAGAAGGPAARAGAPGPRHARPGASARAGRSRPRRGLPAALVAGAVALTAAGGVAAVRLAADDSDAAAGSTPVVLEPADDPGSDPFVPARPGTTAPAEGTASAPGSAGGNGAAGENGSAGGNGSTDPGSTDPGSTDPGSTDPSSAGTGSPDPGSAGTTGSDAPGGGTAVTTPDTDDAGSGATPAAGSPVGGDRPGLYGGSGAEVCDPAGMAAYLAEHPERGAAFAEVEGIPADAIDEHLAALTPVVLRFDTAVTNHGYADGRAVPFQSVLQAGTAVLVDDTGVPQVRCICGNPLEPPAARPAPEYQGDPWPGSAPDEVVVVARSAAPVAEFVLVDDATGAVGARPVGTGGEADRVVDAALAERVRRAGDGGPTSPTEEGTTSADPSRDPSGDGSPPAGPTPSRSGDRPGRPGGTGGSTPDDEPPAEEAPAEEAPGEEAPGEDAPAEDAPAADESPAQEPPAQEPPAQEPPAQEPPAQEPPAEDESVEDAPPGEEAPAEEAPAGEPPAEEAPVEDAPPAGEPATQGPATQGPATQGPATQGPATQGPATQGPATEDAPARP
jgi:hypothetical protein